MTQTEGNPHTIKKIAPGITRGSIKSKVLPLTELEKRTHLLKIANSGILVGKLLKVKIVDLKSKIAHRVLMAYPDKTMVNKIGKLTNKWINATNDLVLAFSNLLPECSDREVNRLMLMKTYLEKEIKSLASKKRPLLATLGLSQITFTDTQLKRLQSIRAKPTIISTIQVTNKTSKKADGISRLIDGLPGHSLGTPVYSTGIAALTATQKPVKSLRV